MEECLFCKIIRKDIPAEIIGENADFICFLDIRPINEGHCLVVPKEHFKDLHDFPQRLGSSYLSFCQEMTKKIVNAVNADGFNIGLNNGRAAGQVVFHQHTHIIPRFVDDGLRSWPHKDVSPAELQAVKQKIIGQ